MPDREELRSRLAIAGDRLGAINQALLDPQSRAVDDLLDVISKYGTPEEINARARQAGQLPNLMQRLRETGSPYVADLEWLLAQRDAGAFVSAGEFRRAALAQVGKGEGPAVDDEFAVTLEISAAQYFPWLIAEARQAVERRELMPGRFVRVRRMTESEADCGDLLAMAAAMQVMGASYVETLDTKGTDGSNVHLGGPATITGYFGGVGQPNDHVLRWVDEYLYYYTNYGVRQVLNVNSGTILAGFLLFKLGIDNEFKISVFTGHDNPYAAMWTLLMARLFARDDGSSPLVGFNWSNSANNQTLEITAQFRRALGFEDVVRFEHHITEAWKSIVIQPYQRRGELVELAGQVANISAKHEGGDPEVEAGRQHPSDILDYFRAKSEVEAAGEMPALLQNYLDKHAAVNATARALAVHGLSFLAAQHLHHR